MAPRQPPSYPPTHHHSTLTHTLSASAAQALLSNYIQASSAHAYLHPTSRLSSTGITHGPNSGPSGGLAMHHLRRIEAGLRGESLAVETADDLMKKFGEDAVGEDAAKAASAEVVVMEQAEDILPESNDAALDALIARQEEAARKERKEQKKRKRKAEEKEGKDGQKRRKRSKEEISAWAEESSKADSPDSAGAQDKQDFERSRPILEGEIGEREGAPVVRQNGAPPVVVKHNNDGEVRIPHKKSGTDRDKAARKAAKQARLLDRKKSRASGAG